MLYLVRHVHDDRNKINQWSLGGFLAGLIIPKENEFDIALVEKLEDLVGLLFLPQVHPHLYNMLYNTATYLLIPVLCSLRPAHRFWNLGHRPHLGVHDINMCCRVLLQIPLLRLDCEGIRL